MSWRWAKLLEKEKEWETEKEQRERETLEAKGKYEEALEKAKGTFSKELADLKADFEKKLKKSTEAVERSENDKKNYILDDKIRRAVIKAGVFADDEQAAAQQVGNAIRIVLVRFVDLGA